jgi:glycerol kinase
MQIQADLLGIPVERAEQRETTAYGAAGLAALQAGVWTPELFAAGARVDRTFEPRLSAERRETARALWRRAVERARDWLSAGETGAA